MSVRIAVIGNCQAPGMAEVLSCALPGSEVEGVAVASLGSEAEIAAFAQRLREFDLIFGQPMEQEHLGPLRTSELQKSHRIVPFPALGFSGYHPDFLGTAGTTRSAAGGYHSAIVAAAYVNGIPRSEAGALLTPFTFARLGYFREFAEGKAFLLRRARRLDYDLAADFEDWAWTGPFMHTPNHPTIRVLIAVALKAAARAGLKADADAAQAATDLLARSVILPVYPPVARRFGGEGSYSISLPGADGGRKEISMSEYILQTYEIYERLPRDFFEHKGIQRVAAQLDAAKSAV